MCGLLLLLLQVLHRAVLRRAGELTGLDRTCSLAQMLYDSEKNSIQARKSAWRRAQPRALLAHVRPAPSRCIGHELAAVSCVTIATPPRAASRHGSRKHVHRADGEEKAQREGTHHIAAHESARLPKARGLRWTIPTARGAGTKRKKTHRKRLSRDDTDVPRQRSAEERGVRTCRPAHPQRTA